MDWVNFKKAFFKATLIACLLLVIAFSSVKWNHSMAKQLAKSLLEEKQVIEMVDEYLDSDVVQETHAKVVGMIRALLDEKMKKIENKFVPKNKNIPHIV